jgi:hypothetical protein
MAKWQQQKRLYLLPTGQLRIFSYRELNEGDIFELLYARIPFEFVPSNFYVAFSSCYPPGIYVHLFTVELMVTL